MSDEEIAPPAEEAPTLTVDHLYAGVLEQLADLDALRHRLLGQADAYHSLIAAGHGSLRVPAPPPTDD